MGDNFRGFHQGLFHLNVVQFSLVRLKVFWSWFEWFNEMTVAILLYYVDDVVAYCVLKSITFNNAITCVGAGSSGHDDV